MTLEVGGRKAQLTHVNNAHTDGDTWVYFADANVLCTGDTMNNTKRYQTIDFANGGDIRGMIRATDTYLEVANDDTKVMTGHGTLAKKADIAEFNTMLKTARERVEKLVKEGKSEAEVVGAEAIEGSRREMGRDRRGRHQLHEDGLQLIQAVVSAASAAFATSTSCSILAPPAATAPMTSPPTTIGNPPGTLVKSPMRTAMLSAFSSGA